MTNVLEFKKVNKNNKKQQDPRLKSISKLTQLIANEINTCATQKETYETILLVQMYIMGLSKNDPILKESMSVISKRFLSDSDNQ